MNVKKWCKVTIILWICTVVVFGAIVYVVDPYFHFHAPFKGISYRLDKLYEQNDGIARNFDYDALIMGTSTSIACDPREASNLWGIDFSKVSYLGGSYRVLSIATEHALEAKPDMQMIIRGLDPVWFITDSKWLGDNVFPDYLYDNTIWNDYKYLYNLDVFFGDVIPVIGRSLKGVPHDEITASEDFESDFTYTRGAKMNLALNEDETSDYQRNLEDNLTVNILDNVKKYPDVEFIFYIPPYSIAWWDTLYCNAGVESVQRRIDFEKYAYEMLLQCDNVRVFGFFDDTELTTNLDNYSDPVHYKAKVNSIILQRIHDGENEITLDNYQEYIDRESEFYTTFDYDSFFADYEE